MSAGGAVYASLWEATCPGHTPCLFIGGGKTPPDDGPSGDFEKQSNDSTPGAGDDERAERHTPVPMCLLPGCPRNLVLPSSVPPQALGFVRFVQASTLAFLNMQKCLTHWEITISPFVRRATIFHGFP